MHAQLAIQSIDIAGTPNRSPPGQPRLKSLQGFPYRLLIRIPRKAYLVSVVVVVVLVFLFSIVGASVVVMVLRTTTLVATIRSPSWV